MLYCPKCGKEIEKWDNFCPKCGFDFRSHSRTLDISKIRSIDLSSIDYALPIFTALGIIGIIFSALGLIYLEKKAAVVIFWIGISMLIAFIIMGVIGIYRMSFPYQEKIKFSKKDIEEMVRNGESLREMDLSEENLPNAILSGADLSRAKLARSNLMGANFWKADLSGANLSGANLARSKLEMANLNGANLSRGNLVDVFLSKADLRKADLGEANLMGADLSGANLIRSNLIGANLWGADFHGIEHDTTFLENLKDTNWRCAEWDEEVLEKLKKMHGS
jgi:uncharacterized protein YjbI with pentapeptide repeats